MNAPTSPRPIVTVHGASGFEDVPRLAELQTAAEFRFAPNGEALTHALPGADILLGWQFAAADLEQAWPAADRLQWIQWCGAGVDAALFPALSQSEVVLTNAHGVFDQPMAEYALGLILAFAKRLPRTLASQRERRWDYHLTETIADKHALVIGVGGIGRAIGHTLRNAGMRVTGVGRRARDGGEAFGRIHPIAELDQLLPQADYVVLITPLTEATRGLFDARRIGLMPAHARFINMGRGALVDEQALIDALASGRLAGAGLDVFETEPLPESSPLWDLDNVIVSPHLSGDFEGFEATMAGIFIDNFARYQRGEPLRNVVDKRLGFVASGA